MIQDFLFVCGAARSGTTTMADLLRAHPAIAMGRERYAWRFKAGAEFSPALFERDRFCLQFSPQDSHHTGLQPYYAELHPRFDRCRYVGDKLPGLYRRYRYVLDTFPQCRIVYMARNVVDVAASFERRASETAARLAADPGLDRSRLWPVERGWRQAVAEWNEGVDATLALDPSVPLLVVDFDALYLDDGLLDRLLAFLQLEPVPALLDAWNQGRRQRRDIETSRPPALDEDTARHIREAAHLQAYSALLDRTW